MSEITLPTIERLRKACHFDKGDPDNSSPEHVRPQRIGTPWDRYCARKVLERHQIEAGEHYARDYSRAMWGRPAGSQTEPSANGSYRGVPAHAIDLAKKVAMADKVLRPHEQVLIQCVLLDGLSADEWARKTGRHEKAGIWALRDALDQLAIHYGYLTK